MSEEETKEVGTGSSVFKTEVQLKEERKKDMKTFNVEDAEPPEDDDEPYSRLPPNVLPKQITVTLPGTRGRTRLRSRVSTTSRRYRASRGRRRQVPMTRGRRKTSGLGSSKKPPRPPKRV